MRKLDLWYPKNHLKCSFLNLLLGLGTQIWCGATYKVDKVYKLGTPICRISHTYDLAPSKESIIKA